MAFRPRVGAHYRYRITVRSVTTTRLEGGAPDRSVDESVLVADHTVLSAGPGEARVEVRLRRAGSADRTLVVRLDRAAQLAGVEAVEGLPPSVLGPDALPELLPGAPGAPPDRPLEPGERWAIDAPAPLADVTATRVRGTGRLARLGLSGGRKVASTTARTELPLRSTVHLAGSTLDLDGTETTEGSETRDLVDGAVEQAMTVTRGQFNVQVEPAGGGAVPAGGTLSIEVRAETHRVATDAV